MAVYIIREFLNQSGCSPQDVLDLEENPGNLVSLGLQVREDAKEIQAIEETSVNKVSRLSRFFLF